MKLPNLKLFISKAFTFFIHFLSTSMFSLLSRIQALAPLPLSWGLIQHQPGLGFDLAVI